jgi:hypothetical protein
MKTKLTSIVLDEFQADIASLFCTQHRETVFFIAEFFEENFESKENDTQILKNVNRHIYLCKQLNKTTFSLWLLSIRI